MLGLLPVGLLILLGAGCTPRQYSKLADKFAYQAIGQKQEEALGQEKAFSIDYHPFASGEGAQLLAGKPIPMGSEPVRTLSLDEALEVAFRNSRTYQTRKETLYSAALALANARHNWTFIGGQITADASAKKTEGSPTVYDGSGNAQLNFAQRFADGGKLALGAGLNAATDFLDIRSTSFGSLLDANFTQPLLRGAWRGFAYETLYRQERDLAFAVFDYERFTQTFATSIVTAYYRVLQQLDELRNEEANIKRLEETFNLTQALVEGGDRSRIELDQTEQDLLNAKVRNASSKQAYQDSLDNFKLTLGLPIQASVDLDPAELQNLTQRGPLALPFKEADAIEIALHARPDVLTQKADVRDARRDVEIAADQFWPAVDLILDINAPGTAPRKPFRTQFDNNVRSASMSFDYSLDQTDNRDRYRNALISEARTKRGYEEFVDRVRLDVRQNYRQLLQAKDSYDLQVRNVAVAQRRRKQAVAEQKLGNAAARDVLEAEEGLRQAQNGLTSAMVTYETTRISFLATLGMLEVQENGKLHERDKPDRFDSLDRRYNPQNPGPG